LDPITRKTYQYWFNDCLRLTAAQVQVAEQIVPKINSSASTQNVENTDTPLIAKIIRVP
jgi:hypothetical protein